jgi:Ser/Thr protein kinase RdoA (MazF antagonist)
MYLTVANLTHFLVSRGLLDPDAILGGDLVILDASRRNRNFKVIRSAGPGLFVKQMREMQQDAMLTLRREAACYERARDDPALSRLMPRLITYEPARHLLIVELLPDAESLADRHLREKTFPAEIGQMLGEGLGLYHARAASILDNEAMRSLFARQVPVVLAWQSGGHAALGQYGRIGPALSAIVQQHPEFQTLLDAIGAEWRFDSLIHGDMKWDNVLVFPTSGGGLDFRIVDWEMADLGDADWDVGAVLQSFLTVWILSMPIASGLPPERYVGMAAQPIELMRPVLRAFWEAYAATRGFAATERKAALERSMRFGAARLVWSVFEQRLYATQLDPAAMALLQVSLNILKNPARAVADLLDV